MFQQPEIEAKLDEEIVRLLESLEKEDKKSKDYTSMIENVTKLYELRHKSRISKETLATIGANVLGLIVLMNHERAHVIASKAFGFVKKIF